MLRWRLTWRVALIPLLFGLAAHADSRLDEVVSRLASTKTFAFGGVGYAGAISQGERDFRFIVSQSAPTALRTLEHLFANGNPQARAYALAGFKRLDRNRYHDLLATAKTSTDQVEIMRGCIVGRESLSQLAEEIDHGEFRL